MRAASAALGLLLLAPSLSADASEEGRNIYLLGSAGLGAGMVPARGIYVSNIGYVYGGTAGSTAEFARGGNVQLGIDANAAIDIPVATWVLPHSIWGGNIGFSLALPYGYSEGAADVTLTGPRGRSIAAGTHDDVFAVGDPQPAAFIGWHTGELHGKLYMLGNIPVGRWSKTSLANLGFNHGAVDLGGALTWLHGEGGIEVSTAVGLTYNFKNDDSDYRSGKELHVEYVIAKHFSGSPLTMGVNGYYYRQVSGDSGSGARLGDFKGEVAAIGPAVNFALMLGRQPAIVDAKFFHEFHTANRLEGNAGFLTVTFPIP